MNKSDIYRMRKKSFQTPEKNKRKILVNQEKILPKSVSVVLTKFEFRKICQKHKLSLKFNNKLGKISKSNLGKN